METSELIIRVVENFERKHPAVVSDCKKLIETGDQQMSFNRLVEYCIEEYAKSQEQIGPKLLFMWAIVRYGSNDNFKLLRGYLDYLINSRNDKSINAARSKKTVFSFLIDAGLISNKNIDDFENENIIFNHGAAKEVTSNVINNIKSNLPKEFTEIDITDTDNKSMTRSKISINTIALLYYYKGQQITRDNANEIAGEYGHNSGEKLFQRYTYYSSRMNRTGMPTPSTPRKLKNKISLFETVIDLLTPDKKKAAEDELLILKSKYNSEYL